jgi:hypothetical protein
MSWDAKKSGRGTRLYYYRTRGGRKRYVGGGVVGREAARRDEEARCRRRERVQQWLGIWSKIEVSEGPLDEFCRGLKLIVRAALVAAGLYQHSRGQWRRRGQHG